MKTSARFVITLVAITALTACDGERARSPTAPLSPPPSPSGQISIRSIAPGSGATLTVRECPYYPSNFNLNFWEMCSEQLKLTFAVEFENDVTNAVITAGFDSGSQRCGLAVSQPALLRASIGASFDAEVILLSDEHVQLLCPLPAETTRMVVQLWERSRPATPLVTQEFAHTYRFAEP